MLICSICNKEIKGDDWLWTRDPNESWDGRYEHKSCYEAKNEGNDDEDAGS